MSDVKYERRVPRAAEKLPGPRFSRDVWKNGLPPRGMTDQIIA
jgi:hypothetical protein